MKRPLIGEVFLFEGFMTFCAVFLCKNNTMLFVTDDLTSGHWMLNIILLPREEVQD